MYNLSIKILVDIYITAKNVPILRFFLKILYFNLLYSVTYQLNFWKVKC